MCHCVQHTLVHEPIAPPLSEKDALATELAMILGNARSLVAFFNDGGRYYKLTLEQLDAAIECGCGLYVSANQWRKAVFLGNTRPQYDDAEILLAGALLMVKELEASLEPGSFQADITGPLVTECLSRALRYYQRVTRRR